MGNVKLLDESNLRVHFMLIVFFVFKDFSDYMWKEDFNEQDN